MDIVGREPDANRRIPVMSVWNVQKMGASEIYRQKADLLLRLSSEAHDAKTRAFLLDEALYWHHEATDAACIASITLADEQARTRAAKP